MNINVILPENITMTESVRCCMCGTEHKLFIGDPQNWIDWKQGKLIQDAMPHLSVAERELLISGTCGACFDEMFGEECCS